MSENKHTQEELKQLQALPLEQKIALSQARIREWLREYGTSGVYVSFSGGKDSTVLLHIVRRMEAEAAEVAETLGLDVSEPIPAVFVNTGLEYPEIQRFAMSQPNVIVLRPEMRFDNVLKKYGYPVISKNVSNAISGARNSIAKGRYSYRLCQLGVGRNEYGGLHDDGTFDYDGTIEGSKFKKDKYRYLLDADFNISDECCNVMKKKPVALYEAETGRVPFLATMATESMNRESAWLKHGCNGFNKKRPSSNPLSFWTEQDILHYIIKYNVPYCSAYGDIVVKPAEDEMEGQINLIDYLGCYEPEDQLTTTGCSRTGCIFCMFGCHMEKEPNRFQRLKETHPRQYAYCINGGEMVDGKWQPNKEGLGLGKVLDYIGVKY